MIRSLNPFEHLSTGKALFWGVAGTILSIALLLLARPLDMMPVKVQYISTNLLLWLPLSLLLYVFALLFSSSRIRAIDIFATNLYALQPTILGLGIFSLLSSWLNDIVCDPRSMGEVLQYAANYAIVIMLSITMVWSIFWGCLAYQISANMKNIRSIVIFVCCYVFVSVLDELLVRYYPNIW